jgi:putative transposase
MRTLLRTQCELRAALIETQHHFRAKGPNELWVTDITEFRIPAGKVYLSPVVDCYDGMPIGWSISTSPDAGMANASLLGACGQLADGDRPMVHSDRVLMSI